MADQNLALYRKYRSATFDEVIGQEHVTEPLKTALAAQRVNHAYLFSGPRGCGKTSSARILARSLNCAQGPTPTPCGVCESCQELAPNGPGSIDVIEIDAASHGGVDDARDLRERAFFAPARDRYKVYIIDEAHMVSTQGFNALLKLVEEPPEFLVFVFATTEPDKVLQTIRSRTHHYPFRLVPPSVMRGHLERICAAEGVAVEQAVFPLVVRAGGGSVRDSLSLLDQLLAGAGPEGVTYARAVALLGVTDAALLDDMIDALIASDAASVYGAVDRVVEAGHDPRRFAADLLDRLRDLLVLDAVPSAAETGLIDSPGDALSRMVDQAQQLGGATAARYAEIVHTALLDMRGTTSPRLVLELVCARMLLPDAATDSAAILQRLDRLERRASLSGSASAQDADVAPARPAAAERPPARPTRAESAPTVTTPTATTSSRAQSTGTTTTPTAGSQPAAASAERAPAAAPSASTEPPSTQPAPAQPDRPEPAAEAGPAAPAARPAAGGALDAAAVRTVWPEVKDVVKAESRRTRALLDPAVISSLDGDLLTLTIASAPLARMLGEDRNADVVARALTQVLGGKWRLAVVPEGAGTESATPPAAPAGPAVPAAEPDPPVEPVRRRPRPEDLAPEPEQAATAPVIDPDADPRDDEPDDPDEPQDSGRRHDPEAEALALLRDGLGARPVDG